MSKKKIYGTLSLVTIMVAGARMLRAGYRLQQQHTQQIQQEQHIQQAKSIQEFEEKQGTTPSQQIEKAGNQFRQILGEAAANDNYDTYTAVDGSYGLGSREGSYYLFRTAQEEEQLLEGIDLAYVLSIDNQDDGVAFKALFARQNGDWVIMNSKGEIELTLGTVELSQDTSFVIKDKTLSLAQ